MRPEAIEYHSLIGQFYPEHRHAVTEAQREAIKAALQRNEPRWAQAARELDVDPSNLHKLARKLGLKGAAQ